MHRQLHIVAATVFLLAAEPCSVQAEELGGGWSPDFTAMITDPETKGYIGQAHSKLGGNCCEWADGYIAGKVYKFTRYPLDSGSPEVTYQVALKAWWQDSDGYYHAIVWDYLNSGRDVELIASYDAFAPYNPTGRPIVWIRNGDAQKLEISCWGGEAQGALPSGRTFADIGEPYIAPPAPPPEPEQDEPEEDGGQNNGKPEFKWLSPCLDITKCQS